MLKTAECKDKVNTIELETVNCLVCNSNQAQVIAKGKDYEYGTVPGEFTFKECKSCKHLYLSPRPTLSVSNLMYSTYYTANNSHKNISIKRSSLVSFFAKQIMLNRIKPFLKYLPQNGVVLEVGFGDGQVLALIKEIRPDVTVIGVDLKVSSSTHSYLEKHSIIVHECAFEDFQTNIKADLIIMTQLIEHLWDVKKSILQIEKILKPNGRVIIATPNSNGYDRKFSKDGAWGQYYWPRHLNIFNAGSLSSLFEEYKLKAEKIQYLACPVGWAQTLKYVTYRMGLKKLSSSINTYNPIILTIFTIIDLIALTFKLKTSNMQIVFSKESKA